jgi:hypothetical protein
MKYALAISPIFAILFGTVLAVGKPLQVAQSQTNFACITNCNSANITCINQCPAAGTASQIAPDVNAAQALTNLNRIDILQNVSPIQCRLNCTTQQQFCYATCR